MQKGELTRQQERLEARRRGAGNRRVLATEFKIIPAATDHGGNSSNSDVVPGVKVTPAGKRRRLDSYPMNTEGSLSNVVPSAEPSSNDGGKDLNDDKENSILPKSLENSPEEVELSNHKNVKKPGWTPGGIKMPQSVRRTNQIDEDRGFSNSHDQTGFFDEGSPIKRALLFPATATEVETSSDNNFIEPDQMSVRSAENHTSPEDDQGLDLSDKQVTEDSLPLNDEQGADKRDTPTPQSPSRDGLSEGNSQLHSEEEHPALDMTSDTQTSPAPGSPEEPDNTNTHEQESSSVDAVEHSIASAAESTEDNKPKRTKSTKSKVRAPPRSKVRVKEAESDEELVALKLQKVPLRAGGTNRVNAMDVISQVCLELSENYASQLETKWTKNALMQYCQVLSQRFSRIIDMIDVNNSIMQAMRRIQVRRNSLREQLLELRGQRIEANHKIEAVREGYQKRRQERLKLTDIGSFADDIKALRELRSSSPSSSKTRADLVTSEGNLEAAPILPLINAQWGSYARLNTLANLLTRLDHGLS